MMITFLKRSWLGIICNSFVSAYAVVKADIETKNKNKKRYYLDLFIIRFIFGLTFFRKLSNEKKIDKNIENYISENNENLIDGLKSLKKYGFIDECTLLNKNYVILKNELITNINNSVIRYRKDKQLENQKIKFKNLDEAVSYVKENDIYIMKSSVNFNESPNLKKIIMNDYFINLAKAYFNNEKISINSTLFISNNHENNDHDLLSGAAQKYHFDIDYKKFFKVIFYLTDVKDVNDGAHIFIPRSHRHKLKKHLITKRYEDEVIESAYDNKKIFLGKRGTYFYVDTFGFHKGSPVKNDFRIAGFIEFGSGHFRLTEDTVFI